VQQKVSAVTGREKVVSSRVEARGIRVFHEKTLIVKRVGEEFRIAQSGMEARCSDADEGSTANRRNGRQTWIPDGTLVSPRQNDCNHAKHESTTYWHCKEVLYLLLILRYITEVRGSLHDVTVTS
jgi:hypothetical protein